MTPTFCPKCFAGKTAVRILRELSINEYECLCTMCGEQEVNPYSQLKERFMAAFDALVGEITEIYHREMQSEVEGLLSPDKEEELTKKEG